MDNKAQLKYQLRTLKLSGILNNLDLRLMEAKQNQLAYSEFIAMILNDEIELRNMRKLNRLISNAGIGTEKILESFDFSFNPKLNVKEIRELGTCKYIEKGENVFFIGPTGTGKTHLAKALCHQACRKYLSVAFFSFHHFFSEFHRNDLKSQAHKLIKRLSKIDLLVIDDFGFRKINQQDAEFLYAIVDNRYHMKSIILTSNRAITDWASVFPDPLIANAILDRLAHNAHQITIKGESYRKKFAPKLKTLD